MCCKSVAVGAVEACLPCAAEYEHIDWDAIELFYNMYIILVCRLITSPPLSRLLESRLRATGQYFSQDSPRRRTSMT